MSEPATFEIKTDMILRHARAYAQTHKLPNDERTFVLALHDFGTQNFGTLEALLDKATATHAKISALMEMPPHRDRIAEVSNARD